MDGPYRTIYVGGQNAVDVQHQIDGSGDLAVQAGQAVRNLKAALAAGGGNLADGVNYKVYVVAGQNLMGAFGAYGQEWGTDVEPPTVSILIVAGLANPEFLIEIEAVAVVKDAA